MANASLHGVQVDDVVSDLSLRLADGEAVAVLGPPRAGKTRLLHAIAGLEPMRRGQVFIDNTAVDGLPPAQRGIGLVLQNEALYPHLDVRENIAFAMRRQHLSERERDEAIEEITCLVGVDGVGEKRPEHLRQCERMRVALGRALARRPRLLLVDDAMAGMSNQERCELREQIRSIQRSWRLTTLYATDDSTDAMALGDRIAYVHSGRLHQVDTPALMYTNPATTAVATALGRPPINLLDGHFDGTTLTVAGQSVEAPGLLQRDTAPGEIVAGIRPESFDVNEIPKNSLQAILDPSSWRTHGSYSVVRGHLDQEPISVHIAGNPVAVPRRAHAPASEILCFSPDSGERLR